MIFNTVDIDGNRYTDREFSKYKVTMVNFWEPWCGPCKMEFGDLQKLYDGAVLYVAETAKGLWPRMDIRPIERSLLYETYDERERYVNRAREILGNTVIDKPEDLTWWLNKETLRGKEES